MLTTKTGLSAQSPEGGKARQEHQALLKSLLWIVLWGEKSRCC